MQAKFGNVLMTENRDLNKEKQLADSRMGVAGGGN
jgi:hypothetical protein